MPKVINGNILNIAQGIICHQVNCKGVMGAGIALQIRRKWPKVYADYREAYMKGLIFLGNITTTEVSPGLFVANLCGQDRYGRAPGVVYTDYPALSVCMALVAKSQRQVYIPHGMGCVNAGGDWTLVNDMIDRYISNAIVVKLN